VPAVNKRIDSAIGKAPADPKEDKTPLKADNIKALIDCLNGVVKDLGAPVVVPPVPGANAKVLITYDANNKDKLPRAQMAILDGTALKNFLDAKVGKGNWRIVPDTAVFNADQPGWAAIMAKPRTSPNWLYVQNDSSADSIPLPANEADAEAEIARFK
jgi:hypothetical protein